MQFELEKKVAFITGGGRGIGKAISLVLAEQGVNIALCGRTLSTLEETADEIKALGSEAWPIVADVSDFDNIKNFVSTAMKAAGRVDILVNNAVTSLQAPFEEQTDDHWRHHIDVKLMAYIRSAREVLPHMEEQRWGRIVNIGGMTARIAAPLRMTNGITNAGVSNFTKQFAGYAGKHNVTVNCVHPGPTATDRLRAGLERRAKDAGLELSEIEREEIESIPMGRLILPQDIAKAVLFFCSPLADIITGQCIAVEGGSSPAVNY